MGEDFRRKPNRMKTYDYSSNGMYFLTICSRGNACIFCDPRTFEPTGVGKTLQDGIEQIGLRYDGVQVEKYVIMPNHVHLLLTLCGATVAIPTIISQYKRYVTRCVGESVWQKSFYDHVVRNEADYYRIWQYIEINPSKWTEDRYYQP